MGDQLEPIGPFSLFWLMKSPPYLLTKAGSPSLGLRAVRKPPGESWNKRPAPENRASNAAEWAL